MAESRSFRYERKFFVEDLEPPEVESVVRHHPALFREVYRPRQVNNIYLDSFDHRNYLDNVDGLLDRVKVRIRWYGELFGRIEQPVLELKVKRGLLGAKEAHRLSPFALGPGFDSRVVRSTLAGSRLSDRVREVARELDPSLVNCYRRRYFLSADGGVRLTLDTDRAFYAVGPHNNRFSFKLRDSKTSIVELKHSPEWEERTIEIASRFPFRMTKSSKYVQGIDLLAMA